MYADEGCYWAPPRHTLDAPGPTSPCVPFCSLPSLLALLQHDLSEEPGSFPQAPLWPLPHLRSPGALRGATPDRAVLPTPGAVPRPLSRAPAPALDAVIPLGQNRGVLSDREPLEGRHPAFHPSAVLKGGRHVLGVRRVGGLTSRCRVLCVHVAGRFLPPHHRPQTRRRLNQHRSRACEPGRKVRGAICD